MHAEVEYFVAAVLTVIGTPETILEFGSRDMNGTLHHLFPNCKPNGHYTGVDNVAGPNVDVVADAGSYKHPEPVDCVICTEMLEHCPWPMLVVMNALDNLKTGGLLIVTCASRRREPHSVEGKPIQGEYYLGLQVGELANWLQTCAAGRVVENEAHGDLYAWAIKGERRPGDSNREASE